MEESALIKSKYCITKMMNTNKDHATQQTERIEQTPLNKEEEIAIG